MCKFSHWFLLLLSLEKERDVNILRGFPCVSHTWVWDKKSIRNDSPQTSMIVTSFVCMTFTVSCYTLKRNTIRSIRYGHNLQNASFFINFPVVARLSVKGVIALWTRLISSHLVSSNFVSCCWFVLLCSQKDVERLFKKGWFVSKVWNVLETRRWWWWVVFSVFGFVFVSKYAAFDWGPWILIVFIIISIWSFNDTTAIDATTAAIIPHNTNVSLVLFLLCVCVSVCMCFVLFLFKLTRPVYETSLTFQRVVLV